MLPDWKFRHPGGRAVLAYKVGSWIADRPIAASGLGAHELVWHPPADGARMAEVRLP